jgi:hypothetical protein
MDVVISGTPTNRHFDPQKICYVVATDKGTGRLMGHHPWSLGRQFRVCAGRIRLTDRVGKVVEAFSLGGVLNIACEKTRTICMLTSSAPIFPLFETMDLSMCLTAEMEIQLAQQRAKWDPEHPYVFEEHLAAVDPFELYACLLEAMHKKGDHLHSGSSELDCDVRHFVDNEIAHLKQKNEWPAAVCSPGQLLLE